MNHVCWLILLEHGHAFLLLPQVAVLTAGKDPRFSSDSVLIDDGLDSLTHEPCSPGHKDNHGFIRNYFGHILQRRDWKLIC